MFSNINLRFNPIEALLGLGLGLGYMTALRFAGPVGVPELMILIALIMLFSNHGRSLFRFEQNPAGFIKLYMLPTVFLIYPIVTLSTTIFTPYDTDPQYIISFMMGIVLSFLIVESLRKHRIDMANIVVWFAAAYILTNILTIIFFPAALEADRYEGSADNPNQLMFYATSLSLILVIYRPVLAFFLLPVITWITMQSGSDAYFLTLFVTAFVYVVINILFSGRFSFGVGMLFSIIAGALFLTYIYNTFYEELALIWLAADQGNTRGYLMLNGFFVSLGSPFFGYGAGNFSGVQGGFEEGEAHNTFLDFSMQFGMVFSLIIYFVFFAFLLNRIKNKYFLQAAFVSAFIVSGLFHFSGRHFIFWVEFAIFYYYVFYHKESGLVK